MLQVAQGVLEELVLQGELVPLVEQEQLEALVLLV